MNTHQSLVVGALAFAFSISVAHAGPCSSEIDSTMVDFQSILEARAAAGPTGQQSTGAQMHRQPTPRSVAAAENAVGDLPVDRIEAVRAAMARARDADGAGDQAACEQALADARRAAGR
jgi:hypothetical protein